MAAPVCSPSPPLGAERAGERWGQSSEHPPLPLPSRLDGRRETVLAITGRSPAGAAGGRTRRRRILPLLPGEERAGREGSCGRARRSCTPMHAPALPSLPMSFIPQAARGGLLPERGGSGQATAGTVLSRVLRRGPSLARCTVVDGTARRSNGSHSIHDWIEWAIHYRYWGEASSAASGAVQFPRAPGTRIRRPVSQALSRSRGCPRGGGSGCRRCSGAACGPVEGDRHRERGVFACDAAADTMALCGREIGRANAAAREAVAGSRAPLRRAS